MTPVGNVPDWGESRAEILVLPPPTPPPPPPPNGLNELPEMRSEFPCKLIGKWTMAFLTGQSWRLLKSWYTGRRPDH